MEGLGGGALGVEAAGVGGCAWLRWSVAGLCAVYKAVRVGGGG
jgi:hypothetical protein